MTTSPPALPETQSANPRGLRPTLKLYAFYLLLVFVPTGFLLDFLLRVAQVYKEIFRDFRTPLPTITQWAMYASSWVHDDYLWIPVVLLALGLAFLLARMTARQPEPQNRMMYMMTTFCLTQVLLVILVYVCNQAITAPLFKLIRTVAGGDGSE